MIEEVVYAPKLARKAHLVRKPIQRSKSTLKRVQGKTRHKKTDLAKLKEKLWELCKQIIRKQYGNICYTCGATNLSGGNWHTGHFIPSSVCGAYLRYDLRNLRPQCYRCNISLAGNGSAFYRNLVHLEGQPYVDELFIDKQRTTKMTKGFLSEKIEHYKTLIHD